MVAYFKSVPVVEFRTHIKDRFNTGFQMRKTLAIWKTNVTQSSNSSIWHEVLLNYVVNYVINYVEDTLFFLQLFSFLKLSLSILEFSVFELELSFSVDLRLSFSFLFCSWCLLTFFSLLSLFLLLFSFSFIYIISFVSWLWNQISYFTS